MSYYAKPAHLTQAQFDQVKNQILPVMSRMSREQIFQMADLLFAEASNRDVPEPKDNWRLEVRV